MLLGCLLTSGSWQTVQPECDLLCGCRSHAAIHSTLPGALDGSKRDHCEAMLVGVLCQAVAASCLRQSSCESCKADADWSLLQMGKLALHELRCSPT